IVLFQYFVCILVHFYPVLFFFLFFFFFQAEDGIRDSSVTGVQTCALPIWQRLALKVLRRHRLLELFLVQTLAMTWDEVHEEAERSEERRVGKECRSRWSQNH